MCSKIGKRYNKDKCPFQSQDAMFWNSFNTQLMKNEQTSSLCFEKTGNVPFINVLCLIYCRPKFLSFCTVWNNKC